MGCTSSLSTAVHKRRSVVKQGETLGPKPYAVCIEINQKNPTTGQLTLRQRQLLRRTWKSFAEDMTGFGVLVFTYIFKARPDVLHMFPFQDIPISELCKDRRFRGHASRFMQAVGATVDNIDNLEMLTPVLTELGQQHCQIDGFDADYFELFMDAMISVWRDRLKQRFRGDVELAWKTVFMFILKQIREGMHLEDSRPFSHSTRETDSTLVH